MAFGLFSVVVGHATFCVVVVYNNVLARLRRPGTSRGGVDGPGRRHVPDVPVRDVPAVRSALFAGGLLAFALCFDEIIVTTFTAGAGVQTLPIWIFRTCSGPTRRR